MNFKFINLPIIVLFLSVTFFSSLSKAGILYYVDANNGLVDGALSDLSLTSTTTSHSNFLSDLSSQVWDLVIIDTAGSSISAANTSALDSYINNGGKSIISHYNYDSNSNLTNAFDVTSTSSLNSPLDVHLWNSSHSIFNGVNGLFDYSDRAGDNGDKFGTINGAVALAGFTSTITPNDAAIVLGNGGNTIANGWLFWDADITANNTRLVANQVDFLLNGSATDVPEPSTLAIFALGMIGLASRRFKKQS